SIWLFWHSTWRLLVYDWRDQNGDGRIWRDLNGNGGANDGEVQTGEDNRLWYSYPTGDLLEGYVSNPLSRRHGGLFLGLQHVDRNGGIPNTTIHLRATFYKHQAWPLLTLDQTAVTVPAHGSATAQVHMAVPAGTAPGAYEGAIAVAWDANRNTVIPVAL